MKKLLALLVAAFLSSNCFPQEIESVNQLFNRFATTNSPGVAVVAVEDGKIVHSKFYGMANLEYDIPITAKTIFHIASVSKQFTAFSILLLEEQGKLNVNDKINKYLVDIPEAMNDIRIKHLIHHTSGLREMETLLQIAGITTADQLGSDYIYELMKNQNQLNFQPGEELEYSNTGYFLLAKIVEKVSGESFKNWTYKNIFLPLSMTNTVFYDDCTAILKNRAFPYWNNNGNLVKGILSYSYVGPTGVNTTSEDMAKWISNFSQIKVGNRKLIDRFLTETDILKSGKITDYGFGLGITTYKNLKVVLHSGHDAAYRAAMLYFPEYKTGIAILSNYYSINPMEYGFKIADIILKDFIKNSKSEVNNEDKENSKKGIPFVLYSDKLVDFVGTYFSDELGVAYRLSIRDNNLIARYWRNDNVILTPENADKFKGDQSWFENVKFIRNHSNVVIRFILSSDRVRNIPFEKIVIAE